MNTNLRRVAVTHSSAPPPTGRHTAPRRSLLKPYGMPSSVVVMFLRISGSTFEPAPWITNLNACSIVSLGEHNTSMRTRQ
ncbi:hypothetical protein F7725_012317 [Dissostichus mawsoni]|uniref:Uncharacterized protein n=1 Tax=Dissostichus mawsoni TaxID=36200 RepID=A0A7J5YMC4_DISMA|nr:hypothetical protein F7725_012317 [Dissostichus mawsoni]